jgi:hypothetical protein
MAATCNLQPAVWQVREDASLDLKALYSAQICQMIRVVQLEQSKMVQVPETDNW